jgi:hypothetical protein
MRRILTFIAIALALTACGSGISEREAAIVATDAALGTPPPAKYQTAAAIYLNLTLTPTPVPPTVDKVTVIDYAATRAANEMLSLLTKQAGEAETERLKVAEAQAQAAAEQSRLNATARADSLNATMTADARTAQAAVDMATAQRADDMTRAAAETKGAMTAVAVATHGAETQAAAITTAEFQPTANMWTSTAVAQEIAIKQGQVADVELAVARQTAKNYFDAFLPWTLTLVAAYVLGRGFQTWVKTRTHPRDEHGRPQTFQRELADGGVVFVRPEQMETGIVKVASDGSVIRYAPMDKGEQSDINRRAQMTDAIAALPMPYARNAQGMMRSEYTAQVGAPSVDIVQEARSLSPVLDEAEGKLLEE